ncbi:hypothetical protein C5167_049026 [Papaver somniferum]|uniref:Uncharacterized protein n=1 Tax=Papaver somniferum TaxID=3469 RepID=A0A4Y7KNT3_PAPSO|nr:hypothetical protein C5167_049026 [Papaver somniferum]
MASEDMNSQLQNLFNLVKSSCDSIKLSNVENRLQKVEIKVEGALNSDSVLRMINESLNNLKSSLDLGSYEKITSNVTKFLTAANEMRDHGSGVEARIMADVEKAIEDRIQLMSTTEKLEKEQSKLRITQ